jgi:CubicO group peptidase (beta-lactamase class C family)
MTVHRFPLDHWPTARWPCAAPSEVGIEAAPILALDAEFARGDHGFVDGLTIIRHGAIVFDRSYPHDYATAYGGRDTTLSPYNYFHPAWHPYYHGTDLHTLQSVTKSVTAVLVGMALARHELPTLDVPLLQYFDTTAIDHLDDRKQRITLRHLLTMSAGLDWDELSVPYEDPTNVCQHMEQSADWVGFTLNRPMAYEPGTVFAYNSGLSHLLSPILLHATGSPVDAYAATHLFQPLGITDFHWKRAPGDLPDTQSGLYLRRTDLAKIGYLYLRDGWWEGHGLVPEGWVQASTRPAMPHVRPHTDYGYHWWLLTDEAPRRTAAWAAFGYGGQYLLLVPEVAVILVVTGWNIAEYPDVDPYVTLHRILRAVR